MPIRRSAVCCYQAASKSRLRTRSIMYMTKQRHGRTSLSALLLVVSPLRPLLSQLCSEFNQTASASALGPVQMSIPETSISLVFK